MLVAHPPAAGTPAGRIELRLGSTEVGVVTAGPGEAIRAGRRAGAASVATSTAPFAGDPHGPPQSQWQVTITVD